MGACWCVRSSGFEYAVGEMNEFAHSRADDDHGRLAGRMEPRAHCANRGIPAQGGDRRKVQGLAQAGPIFDRRLRPRSVPDSTMRGTRPAKAAAWRALVYGLSKSSAMSTAAMPSPYTGIVEISSRSARSPEWRSR